MFVRREPVSKSLTRVSDEQEQTCVSYRAPTRTEGRLRLINHETSELAVPIGWF